MIFPRVKKKKKPMENFSDFGTFEPCNEHFPKYGVQSNLELRKKGIECVFCDKHKMEKKDVFRFFSKPIKERKEISIKKISEDEYAVFYHKKYIVANPLALLGTDEEAVKKTKIELTEDEQRYYDLAKELSQYDPKRGKEEALLMLQKIREAYKDEEKKGALLKKTLATKPNKLVVFVVPRILYSNSSSAQYIVRIEKLPIYNDKDELLSQRKLEKNYNNQANALGLAPEIYTSLIYEDQVYGNYEVYSLQDYAQGNTLSAIDYEDLKDLYDDNASPLFVLRNKILEAVFKKVEKLHENDVYHGDLNPANIIIKKGDLKPKISFIDFTYRPILNIREEKQTVRDFGLDPKTGNFIAMKLPLFFDFITFILYYQYKSKSDILYLKDDTAGTLFLGDYFSIEGASFHPCLKMLFSYEKKYPEVLENVVLISKFFEALRKTLDKDGYFRSKTVDSVFAPDSPKMQNVDSRKDFFFNLTFFIYYASEKERDEFVINAYGDFIDTKEQPIWYNTAMKILYNGS